VQIENEFTVAVPPDELWRFLLDVERIAPCMPGAELTETVDERSWRGKVNMKLGPVSLSFAGTVVMEERDDVAHRAKLRAKGMEQKGKGAANATVESWLVPDGDRTTVKMVADIQLSGAVAQLSRGLLPEVSKRLTQQFADCLRDTVVAGDASSVDVLDGAEAAADVGAARPADRSDTPSPARTTTSPAIGGFRLGLAALWGAIVNAFRKLFGGR
jgi:carbon monoxide dehydrogenase subunit G